METKTAVLPLVTLLVVTVVSATGAGDACPGRKPNVGCNLRVFFQGVAASCNRIPASSVTSAPTVKWRESLPYLGDVFVLLMVDPDAPAPCPAPPAYYLHWLVTAQSTSAGVVQPVETYVKYAPPTPPQGTHRYQLLLYRLPARALSVDAVPEKRSRFSLENFVRTAGIDSEPEASFQFLYRP